MEGLMVMSYWTSPIRSTRVTVAALREWSGLVISLLFVAMLLSFMVVPGPNNAHVGPSLLIWACSFGTTALVILNQWLRYRDEILHVQHVTPLVFAANIFMVLPWMGMIMAAASQVDEKLSPSSSLTYAGMTFVFLVYQRCLGGVAWGTANPGWRRRTLLYGNTRMRLLHIAVGLALMVAFFEPRASLMIIFLANAIFLWKELESTVAIPLHNLEDLQTKTKEPEFNSDPRSSSGTRLRSRVVSTPRGSKL